MTMKINERKRKGGKSIINIKGMSEDEVVEVLYKVAREIAPKYKFGYHSNDDMVQHAIMEALVVLEKGKFVPRGATDLARQLSAFMRVHMRNRCHNLVRNKSRRYSSKDSFLNKAKYNIMHPLYIYNQNLKEDFFVQGENDRNELHDCLDYIRVNLTADQLMDFDSIRDGKKISASKQKKLMGAIERLFDEVDDGEEVKAE